MLRIAVALALALGILTSAPAAASPDASPDARPIVVVAPWGGPGFFPPAFGFRPWAPFPAYAPFTVPVPVPAYVPAQLALPGVAAPVLPAYTPNTALTVGASPAATGPVAVTCWYYPSEQRARC